MDKEPSTKQLEHCREIGRRREEVHAILTRYEGEALWDSIKAKDVDPDILEYIRLEIDNGKELWQIRRDMGIRSQTSKAWVKISAALKGGYRVDSAGLYVKMLSRNQKLAGKLFKILDEVLDQDVETLKYKTDHKGVPLIGTYAKDITPMIDALNRLDQGAVKIGKDLGIFIEGDHGKGSSAPTIIIQNNVPIPMPVAVRKADVEVKSVVKSEA